MYYCNYKLQLNKKYPDNFVYIKEYEPYIKQMHKRVEDINFRETELGTDNTSYTINKGDEMVVCLRDKTNNKLHDINTIMYVTIHELAHVGCPELNHTKLFFKINKFLLNEAMEMKIYQYRDYNSSPVEYCGISLNSTILS